MGAVVPGCIFVLDNSRFQRNPLNTRRRPRRQHETGQLAKVVMAAVIATPPSKPLDAASAP